MGRSKARPVGRDRRHAKGPDRAPLHVGGEIILWLRRRDFAGIGIDGLLGGGLRLLATPGPRLLEAIALAVHFQDVDVVGQAIEQRAGEPLIAEDAGPFVEWQIGCDDRRSPFVTLAEHLEEQFGAPVCDSGT